MIVPTAPMFSYRLHVACKTTLVALLVEKRTLIYISTVNSRYNVIEYYGIFDLAKYSFIGLTITIRLRRRYSSGLNLRSCNERVP